MEALSKTEIQNITDSLQYSENYPILKLEFIQSSYNFVVVKTFFLLT